MCKKLPAGASCSDVRLRRDNIDPVLADALAAGHGCLREAVGMTTRLTHLAINADDLDASRRFYSGVLGLDFAEYLGPEFLRTKLDGLLVVLQRRRLIG